MAIKQISIFLQNKTGHLSEVTTLLGEADIDIRALSIADTSDFGILRLIVSDPEKAYEILNAADIMVSLTDVAAVAVEDKPGGFARLAQLLAVENVNIEYLYVFASRATNRAFAVIRAEDMNKCMDVLKKHNAEILTNQEAYLG